MEKFTSVPEIDGLFWYFANDAAAPRPVQINQAKWGSKFKSFNGAEQSWLREGEYLLGPQPAPDETLADVRKDWIDVLTKMNKVIQEAECISPVVKEIADSKVAWLRGDIVVGEYEKNC
jgi:hypothetical protein